MSNGRRILLTRQQLYFVFWRDTVSLSELSLPNMPCLETYQKAARLKHSMEKRVDLLTVLSRHVTNLITNHSTLFFFKITHC